MAGEMGKSSSLPGSLNNLVESSWRQWRTAPRSFENDKDVFGGCWRALLSEIRGQAHEEAWRDGDHALVPTFAGGDEDSALARKDILQPQAQDFAAPETAKEHRLHHGPVTVPAECRQKAVGRLGREDTWKRAWRTQQRYSAQALPSASSSGGQPARDGIRHDSSITACDEVSEQP